jgi:hypothetical protein
MGQHYYASLGTLVKGCHHDLRKVVPPCLSPSNQTVKHDQLIHLTEFVLVPSKCHFVNSRSYLNSTPVRTNPATSHDILQIQPILTSLLEALDNHIVMTTAFSTPDGYAALHHLWYRVQSLCLSLQTHTHKSNMAVMSWPWHIQKPCIALCFWDKMWCSCGCHLVFSRRNAVTQCSSVAP